MITWLRRREHVPDTDLSAYIDGALPSRRVERVHRHIEVCAACREALDGLRAAKAVLADLPRERPSLSFVLSATAAGARTPAPVPTRRPALAFAPAVALSLLVALLAVDFAVLPDDGADERSAPGLAAAERPMSEATAADGAFAAPNVAEAPTDADTMRSAAAAAPPEAAPMQAEAQKDDAAAAPPVAEEAARTPDDGDSSDRSLIRALEAITAVAFVVALIAVIGARSGRRRINP